MTKSASKVRINQRRYALPLVFCLVLANATTGCQSSSKTNPAQQNSNASTQASGSAPAGSAPSPAQLTGTYVLTEIHDKGFVNIVSAVNTTISFTPDGKYDRVSIKEGSTYHADSGLFRIVGDKLELTIQSSKTEIFNPPRVRTHEFVLEANGEELRLTSDDGKVAVYRRSDSLNR